MKRKIKDLRIALGRLFLRQEEIELLSKACKSWHKNITAVLFLSQSIQATHKIKLEQEQLDYFILPKYRING